MRSGSDAVWTGGNAMREKSFLRGKRFDLAWILSFALVLLAVWDDPSSAVSPSTPNAPNNPVLAPSTLEGLLALLNGAPGELRHQPSFYTHELHENLQRVYHEEVRLATATLDRKLPKPEKFQRMFATLDQSNRSVDDRLAAYARQDPLKDSDTIAANAFTQLSSNSVTKRQSHSSYDPFGSIGYCFGRAAYVHYLLLQAGVPQQHIAKIFGIGKLKLEQRLWDYHMATMIPGNQGQWLVIDNQFEKVLTHQEWMQRVARFDIKQDLSQVRFYVTDPRKFQPAYNKYSLGDFNIPELKGFFEDLLKTLPLAPSNPKP